MTKHQVSKTIAIHQTADVGRSNFHIYVRGAYHCSCVSMEEAKRIATERFGSAA